MHLELANLTYMHVCHSEVDEVSDGHGGTLLDQIFRFQFCRVKLRQLCVTRSKRELICLCWRVHASAKSCLHCTAAGHCMPPHWAAVPIGSAVLLSEIMAAAGLDR